MNSAGLSKEEILALARKKVGDIFDVTVEDSDDYFGLVLKTRCDFYPKSEVNHGIRKVLYNGEKIEKLETMVSEKMHKEVDEAVLDFGTEFVDKLIEKLGLGDIYKQRYTDTNILYKVKRYYSETEGNSTYTRDLLLYYIDKFKELIPAYQPLWSLIVFEVTGHENEEAMEEYMRAIGDRMQHVIFAYDTIQDILAEKKNDNDIFFAVTFHLWYLVSLVKTLGDNLAWMINLYLKLGIPHYQTDLLKEYFRNRVMNANPRIASLIFQNPKFKDYTALNEYRDIVQHRHVIHAMPVMFGGFPHKRERIVIPKDPESLVRDKARVLKKGPATPVRFIVDNKSQEYHGSNESAIYFGSFEDDDFYDPLEFCKLQIDFISDVFNKVLNEIWEELSREPIGEVVNYYSRVNAAELRLKGELKVGESVIIEGPTTHFVQKIESMEINKSKVQSCQNCNVAVQVKEKVRVKDKVYKIVDRLPEDKHRIITKHFG